MADWQRILREHGRTVWQVAWRLLGDRSDAEECFQETFLSAYEVSCREEVRDWPALLKTLATRRALDLLRAKIRREDGLDRSTDCGRIPGEAPQPHQQARRNELADRLRRAMTALSPRQAEVFSLRFVEGMRYEEIGRALDLTTNAVGVLLHEARERLRERLGEGNENARRTTGTR
ncbi:MAG: sigma-70 family RNA polymerase sigma factor [Candidatus Brocadiaceae bacterium]|jgi:RNA polymerase sigma-70 factor (ECF subfamily)